MSDRPADRPTCAHGNKAGGPCLACYHEDKQANRRVASLVDRYWHSRGNVDLLSLLTSAYKRGAADMKKEQDGQS